MAELTKLYDARIAAGDLTDDPGQRVVLSQLQRVITDLGDRPTPPAGLRAFFRKFAPEPVKGLYLWGGVGRGKSMLMDLFVDALPTKKKRRVHFHAFMQEVHAALHRVRKTGADDAIKPVAADLAEGLEVLAFDEMQITAISDAMIVGRLFEQLFDAGVAIVCTSNRPPADLYKDGLNRSLFLPFIALLEVRMEVFELGTDTDYRQERLAGEQVYFHPLSAANREAIAGIWKRFAGDHAVPLVLEVQGRQVEIPAFHSGVARASFYDLCGRPLGPADYLALAEAVRVLVLEDIPRLGRSNFNEAKRFVTLIDALYEAKVRLIASAASRPEMLYLEGEGSFEFERTASRLAEMQGADWGAERTD